MSTRALLFLSLLAAGCGGRTSTDVANRDAAGVTPPQDAGADVIDASEENPRPDCPSAAWESACASMAQAYCGNFVPCFLDAAIPATRDGEHYSSVAECLDVQAHACKTRTPTFAVCTSNLKECLAAMQRSTCNDILRIDNSLPTFVDVCGDDYLSGPAAPPPK